MFVPAGGDPESHEFADGTFAVPGRTYPVRYRPAENDHLVEDDFNDAAYRGFRLSGAFAITDDWTLNVSHHQQTLTADGVFDYDQEVGDLEVARYSEDSLNDAFGQTSWTLEGRLGMLDAIYTGAYLEREVEHSYDYSEYVNVGGYIPGYICEYNTPGYHGGGGVGYSYDPTLSGDPGVIDCVPGDGAFLGATDFDRTNHEFRLQTEIAGRIGLTGGVFFQEREALHTGNFRYGIDGGNPIDPSRISRGRARSTVIRSPEVQFTNDIVRPEEETAFFGELSVNITEDLAATVGARQYTLETGFEGFSAFRYGNRPVPNLAGERGVTVMPNVTGGRDYATNLGGFQPLEVDDVITRFGLSWHASDDVAAVWGGVRRLPTARLQPRRCGGGGNRAGRGGAGQRRSRRLPGLLHSRHLPQRQRPEHGVRLEDGADGSDAAAQRLHLQHQLGRHSGLPLRLAEHLHLHHRGQRRRRRNPRPRGGHGVAGERQPVDLRGAVLQRHGVGGGESHLRLRGGGCRQPTAADSGTAVQRAGAATSGRWPAAWRTGSFRSSMPARASTHWWTSPAPTRARCRIPTPSSTQAPAIAATRAGPRNSSSTTSPTNVPSCTSTGRTSASGSRPIVR